MIHVFKKLPILLYLFVLIASKAHGAAYPQPWIKQLPPHLQKFIEDGHMGNDLSHFDGFSLSELKIIVRDARTAMEYQKQLNDGARRIQLRSQQQEEAKRQKEAAAAKQEEEARLHQEAAKRQQEEAKRQEEIARQQEKTAKAHSATCPQPWILKLPQYLQDFIKDGHMDVSCLNALSPFEGKRIVQHTFKEKQRQIQQEKFEEHRWIFQIPKKQRLLYLFASTVTHETFIEILNSMPEKRAQQLQEEQAEWERENAVKQAAQQEIDEIPMDHCVPYEKFAPQLAAVTASHEQLRPILPDGLYKEDSFSFTIDAPEAVYILLKLTEDPTPVSFTTPIFDYINHPGRPGSYINKLDVKWPGWDENDHTCAMFGIEIKLGDLKRVPKEVDGLVGSNNFAYENIYIDSRGRAIPQRSINCLICPKKINGASVEVGAPIRCKIDYAFCFENGRYSCYHRMARFDTAYHFKNLRESK